MDTVDLAKEIFPLFNKPQHTDATIRKVNPMDSDGKFEITWYDGINEDAVSEYLKGKGWIFSTDRYFSIRFRKKLLEQTSIALGWPAGLLRVIEICNHSGGKGTYYQAKEYACYWQVGKYNLVEFLDMLARRLNSWDLENYENILSVIQQMNVNTCEQ